MTPQERTLLEGLMAAPGAPSGRYRAEWKESGACRGSTVTFIPEYRSEATATEAMAICAGCTAQVACLKEALSDPQLVGIWAGTTSAERRKLRRQRAA